MTSAAAAVVIPLRAIIERADRACVDVDPEVFFPPTNTPAAVEYAKQFCRRCPVLHDCRTWAVAHAETDGIWGGTTEPERRRRRARAASTAGDGPDADRRVSAGPRSRNGTSPMPPCTPASST